ncbi:MAG: alpha-glucosidase/alpha-galactosidase, partial [Rhodobacteraceae bacterium]|nr:alpha-glucosidase/alpha-galactosidase [Paracoccaceae bacterium]
MPGTPKVSFIGAGSTVFVQNLIGDILVREALRDAEIALMDIDADRLEGAGLRIRKMIESLGLEVSVTSHTDLRAAIDGADFVIVAFQIGGYDPCTLTDFAVPARYGIRQTIGDTLGIGGIMRGLRTVPHLWSLCEAVHELCPDAILLQYVNPMAINCWAIAERYPEVRTVGLCHSVQGTIAELAHDLDLPVEAIRYRCAGINHMAFFTELQSVDRQGRIQDLYPLLRDAYRDGRVPKPNQWNLRCPNHVRYEV